MAAAISGVITWCLSRKRSICSDLKTPVSSTPLDAIWLSRLSVVIEYLSSGRCNDNWVGRYNNGVQSCG